MDALRKSAPLALCSSGIGVGIGLARTHADAEPCVRWNGMEGMVTTGGLLGGRNLPNSLVR